MRDLEIIRSKNISVCVIRSTFSWMNEIYSERGPMKFYTLQSLRAKALMVLFPIFCLSCFLMADGPKTPQEEQTAILRIIAYYKENDHVRVVNEIEKLHLSDDLAFIRTLETDKDSSIYHYDPGQKDQLENVLTGWLKGQFADTMELAHPTDMATAHAAAADEGE